MIVIQNFGHSLFFRYVLTVTLEITEALEELLTSIPLSAYSEDHACVLQLTSACKHGLGH
jgi:hypothetical protein